MGSGKKREGEREREREIDVYLQFVRAVGWSVWSVSVFERREHFERVRLLERLLGQRQQLPDCNSEKPLKYIINKLLKRAFGKCQIRNRVALFKKGTTRRKKVSKTQRVEEPCFFLKKRGFFYPKIAYGIKRAT